MSADNLISRRALLRGVGAAAAVAATVGAVEIAGSDAAGAAQSGWSWCQLCRGIWYPGTGGGACVANHGLSHSKGSRVYIMHTAGENVAAYWQSHWFYCHKCHLLYHSDRGTDGICSAGGLHENSSSANYAVAHIGQADYPAQHDWYFCRHCLGLWYYDGVDRGSCPTYGGHVYGSVDYELNYKA